jgi:hypothetical protein
MYYYPLTHPATQPTQHLVSQGQQGAGSPCGYGLCTALRLALQWMERMGSVQAAALPTQNCLSVGMVYIQVSDLV